MSHDTHQILTSSDEANWRTPEWLRLALKREFDIGLDAAADEQGTLLPFLWLGPGGMVDDALSLDHWGDFLTERQAVFCNPPYSRRQHMPIEPWFQRLAATGRTRTAIGVVPYAPQTQHWRRYVVGHDCRATEIRRFPFRVKFDPPPGYENRAKDGKTHGANVNTAVVIWKPTSEYPKALPWAPFERYWVPTELGKAAGRYHDDAELEGGEDE